MLFINTLILAISSSMDSLGIGITYGLKQTKLSKISKLILFIISILVILLSGIIGNILKNILPTKFFELIGSLILIGMGIFIIIETKGKEYSFDLDHSGFIDYKEACVLGLALSLDSMCIGIGAVALGLNIYLFSILASFLQYAFLSLGNFLGMKLISFKFVPQSIWTIISGSILILIGLFKI